MLLASIMGNWQSLNIMHHAYSPETQNPDITKTDTKSDIYLVYLKVWVWADDCAAAEVNSLA